MEPLILAIDTSCDETSAAVTCGRRILSNVVSSQIEIHQKFGGVFPALAKRAHQAKIDTVIREAMLRARASFPNPNLNTHYSLPENLSLRSAEITSSPPRVDPRNDNYFRHKPQTTSYPLPVAPVSYNLQPTTYNLINAVAVTYGPGLAIALEVGIAKAKEIAAGVDTKIAKDEVDIRILGYYDTTTVNDYPKNLVPNIPISQYPNIARIPLLAINHMEGHLYSTLAQNQAGKPIREIVFPGLVLLVSGGHTEMALMTDHGKYELIGQTLDDACGEALDKAARILKLGYPGGPIIERLAERGDSASFPLNPPLKDKTNFNFSYSGLKTQFLYLVEKMDNNKFDQNIYNLAASFQAAAFSQIIRKLSFAIAKYRTSTLITGGGVLANQTFRKQLRAVAKKYRSAIFFPVTKKLCTDNAAMIGVAAYYKYLRGEFTDPNLLDRVPRLNLA